jgi:hypothetical protein
MELMAYTWGSLSGSTVYLYREGGVSYIPNTTGLLAAEFLAYTWAFPSVK